MLLLQIPTATLQRVEYGLPYGVSLPLPYGAGEHTFITIAANRSGRVLAITPASKPPALFTCAPILAGVVNPADTSCSAHACNAIGNPPESQRKSRVRQEAIARARAGEAGEATVFGLTFLVFKNNQS